MNELILLKMGFMDIAPFIGFAFWAIAGWFIGRTFLRQSYVESGPLINIKLMRKIEDDNFKKNKEITKLKEQIKRLEAENKKWKKKSHRTEADHL